MLHPDTDASRPSGQQWVVIEPVTAGPYGDRRGTSEWKNRLMSTASTGSGVSSTPGDKVVTLRVESGRGEAAAEIELRRTTADVFTLRDGKIDPPRPLSRPH